MSGAGRISFSSRANVFANFHHSTNATNNSFSNHSHNNSSSDDADIYWCTDPGPENRFNVAFFVSCITFILSLCGFIVILYSRELRRMTGGILMCSMCLCGMVTPVMQSINNFTLTGLNVFLPICITTQILTNTMLSCVAITTIAALALDKAVFVSLHMRYLTVITPTKCIILSVVQWCLCLVVNCAPVIDPNVVWCMKRYNGCGYKSTISFYIVLAVVYLPSVCIIVGSYIKIWCTIRRLQASDNASDTTSLTTGIRTTLLIFLAFILCTCPIAVYASIDFHMTNFEDVATYIFNLSPAVSILIYGGTSRNFKHSVRNLLRMGHTCRSGRWNSTLGRSGSDHVNNFQMSITSITEVSMQTK